MITIKMAYTYLSLGTNMGNRLECLKEAKTRISAGTGVIKSVSGVYESAPWGFDAPQCFLNMVVGIVTPLSPLSLLHSCKAIECSMGRATKLPDEGYTSRPIDIDILFYDNEIISEPSLIIPHQHLHNRRFVLEPMCELAPLFIHPVLQKTIEELSFICTDKLMVKKIG